MLLNARTLMPEKGRNKKRDAQELNVIEYRLWVNYLTNLYLNMFEWKGMPDTVNLRYLEERLYLEGKALFVADKSYGYLGLGGSGEGGFNVYYEPIKWRALGNNYSEVFDIDECVLIRENELMYPPVIYMRHWARKIADAGRTIDVYSKTMKKPWIFTTDQDAKVTLQTMTELIDENETLILMNGRLSSEPLKGLANPMDGQGLMALWRNKHELLDECMTWMGINNANTEKRERLITSEVESNNQLVQLNIDTCLDWRKRAAEEINEKFGLNVTVDLRHDYLKEVVENREEDNDDDSNDGAERDK